MCGRGMHGGWGGGRRGWGPPFGPPFRGPGGGRRRRGDVRAAILALLLERPMHGYEMIQELESRTSGAWRPSAGSIYPTLQLLEDEGLVAGEQSDGRRRFALTDAGRSEAEGLERRVNVRRAGARIRGAGVLDRVVHTLAGVLDIEDLVAERAQPE